MRGRFITFEGGEGVGKSTQARAVLAALHARGIDALLTREPGGSEGAEAIRNLVLSGAEDRWGVRAEALLFAAARADHVRRVIRPALDAGQWVICDRFIDSSRAYQGGAGLISDDDIMMLHNFGSRGMMPDRTILLSMPVDEADARVLARDGSAADRFQQRSDDFHAEVAITFITIAQTEPKRVRIVDASGTAEEVTERVLGALSDYL